MNALSIAGTEEVVEDCTVVHRAIYSGDVLLHYVECGPPSGQLLLLLHGFPSFWYTWKLQLGPLSRAGYHVVAPDLRGYNLSDKPEGVQNYSRAALTADIVAFIDQLNGGKPAFVVGHDWGGNVAWAVSQEYPNKISRLAQLNIPHPRSFWKAVHTDPAQMKRSWYIFLFQMPGFGETFMRANNFESLRNIISDGVNRPQPKEHTERHVEAFSRPGALKSSIDFYRALFRYWSKSERAKDVTDIPVAVIWGENDTAFISSLSDPPKDLVPNCHVLHVPTATHWVMWDEPELVNNRLLEFFSEQLSTNETTSKL